MPSNVRRDLATASPGRAKTFLAIVVGSGAGLRGVARAIRAGGATAVCVIVGLWLGSGVANAASWSLERVPVPALPYGELLAVSCTSMSSCTAVGSIPDTSAPGAVERPLVEHWDGSRWTDESTPEPAGARQAALTAVSCASRRMCVAVGSFTNAHGSHVGLVERWNGSSWSIQASPASGPGLNGVSCSSGSFCVAVGGSVVERWQSSRWSVWRSLKGTTLVSVSCVSRRACAVVGSRRGKTLAEWFNGSRWSIKRTPNPVAGNFGRGTVNVRELAAVSCTSARACTAVGASTSYCNYCNDESDITLALRWDGRSWRRQHSPTFDDFVAVSCTSSSACVALGTGAFGPKQKVYRWNGSRWKTITAVRYPFLNDVSCTSPKTCTAVGTLIIGSPVSDLTFAGRWNGHRLVPENTSTTADRPARAALTGVSCPSATDCTAVGAFEKGNGQSSALAEHWNGSAWAMGPPPGPGLTGVSCVSSTFCVAVGPYCLGAGCFANTALIDRWNGLTWTSQPVPLPPSTDGSSLNAVSCTSVTACTAVGYVEAPNPNGGGVGTFALVERWDGSRWTSESAPPTSQTLFDGLTGVSCVSATFCAAVGPYSTQSDFWNGSSWTGKDFEQPPQPTPQSALVASIYGVSCTSPSACVAVGKVNQENAPPLAESWNGSNWTIQSTQATTIPGTNLGSSLLTDVSCVSPHACLAVGPGSTDNADVGPLAEALNGSSWKAQTLPQTNFLPMMSGVSCTAPLYCTAVGQLESEGGLVGEGPLVARYF